MTVQPGRLIIKKHISRAEVRAAPNALFAFGDNMAQSGSGGQAAEMRGEPNAVGIPTKWKPSMEESAFFDESDATDIRVLEAINIAFARLRHQLLIGGDVIWPADGVGTGLAQLPQRSPAIFDFIAKKFRELEVSASRSP